MRARLHVGQPGMTPRDAFSPNCVVMQPCGAESIEGWGPVVSVTGWECSHRLVSAPVDPAVGWYGGLPRSPYALGGLVVAVGVLATLMVCLVIALVALVTWVSAHALAVGVGVGAVVVSAVFVRALAGGGGGCCR